MLYLNIMSFKTNLPKKIISIKDAKNFLQSLIDNDEVYHPEDDAHDIIWSNGVNPTDEQKDTLNKLMSDIYELEGNNNASDMIFDPCAYIIENSIDDQHF